jgi:tetratricopeptide (TPR) repeat protein
MSDPQDPAEAARLRRQRLLRRAVENMGVLPTQRGPEGAVAVSSTAAAAAAPPPPPSSLTPEERAFAEQLDARATSLAGKDHFTVLGVPQTATKEQVKAAFLQLAKTYHPDRLPLPLQASHGARINAVFDAIRAANDALQDDAARAQYVEALKAGPPKPGFKPGVKGEPEPLEQQVRELMRTGELQLKRKEFAAAERTFARAHELDGKHAESLAAKAWAVFLDPSRKEELPAVRQLLQDALKLDPKCARAHYQLGVMARVQGDPAASEKHFRAAVAANPRHAEASAEVRLLEIRKKNQLTPPKKGLFGG